MSITSTGKVRQPRHRIFGHQTRAEYTHARDSSYDEDSRKFLFGGAPRWIGVFLTSRLDLVFAVGCALGLLMILIAQLCGVLSVPAHVVDKTAKFQYTDLGYFWTLNWSIMFTLVLPYIFSIVASLNRMCLKVIARLCDAKIGIIQAVDGGPATGYVELMAEQINRKARERVLISLVLTAIIVVPDLWRITNDYRHVALHPNALPIHNTDFIGRWATVSLFHGGIIRELNYAFVIFAYSIEFLYIFLSFYWMFTFWRFLKAFSSLIVPVDTPYQINLWIHDRENRLGLGSLGKLFTGFLKVIVIFFFYGASYAFMVSAWSQSMTEAQYFDFLIGQKDVVLKSLSNPTSGFIRSLVSDLQISEAGLTALRVFGMIPVAVIVYVPLIVLRRHLENLLDEERFKNLQMYKQAQENGDEKTMKKLEEVWKKLKEAEVWPCGNSTAMRYFTYMVLLLIAIFFPSIGILLIVGIAAGVVLRKLLPLLPWKAG